ncbi:MAG TPA: zinc ribbon domain-containing protein [Chloroflexia bacterium]|nr:zinc ribbon domain-containing protein [Chloroflexia bacterium]
MNDNNEQTAGEAAAQALSGLGQSLKRGFDRVGFEADKMMRTNRVRSESQRLSRQASKLMSQISEKVLELEAEGAELEPSLQALVSQVRDLRKKLASKADEIKMISTEAWVEPPPDPPGQLGQGTQATLPSGKQVIIDGTAERRETPRPTVCPVCNGPLRPNSAFCPNCGHKL